MNRIKDASVKKELYVGLMSGTSMDGIDAALVEFKSATDFRILKSSFTPFSIEFKERIAYTSQHNEQLKRNEDSSLHKDLAPLYAEAATDLIQSLSLPASSIRAIANHGQTVKHEPDQKPPLSLQLGDGQIIADQTGIRTISQFRQADLAIGGQGAPLMPAFHRAAFADQPNTFIVNIGGISNVSFLGQPLLGYDTGPGNCLMDQWISRTLGHDFDQDGRWAQTANYDKELLDRLLKDQYFSQSAPKSTGTDYFNLNWLETYLANDIKPEVVQRTLLQLTIESISNEILRVRENGAIYVCGGGADNPLLMASLQQRLQHFSVNNTDAIGLPSDQLEAIGFAWLGYCFDHNLVSNAPTVTGASKECVLGELFEPKPKAVSNQLKN